MPFREHNSILSFCCCGELLSADIKEYLCSISLLPVYIYAQAPAPAVKRVRFLQQLRLNASIVGRENSARRRDSPCAPIALRTQTRPRWVPLKPRAPATRATLATPGRVLAQLVRRAHTRTPQAALTARPAARASTTLILQKLRPVTAPTVARASPALLLALLWTPPAHSVALDSTRGREQVYRNDKKPCQMIYKFHVCYIHPLFNSTIIQWDQIGKHTKGPLTFLLTSQSA
jgi:hypothetical protein